MPEWTPYACSIPKATGYKPGDGSALSKVYHVVHVPVARRILEDGRLRAGLVYDESKLNRSRLCVTWLSANTWAYGSIYGNVQFAFDWHDILAKRRVYWVEAMIDYAPHAYRLLLTERDLRGSKNVLPYDPNIDVGPLRRRGSEWFWNGDRTSEFMIEADVPLTDCKALSFIGHHPSLCRPDGQQCPDRSASPEKTGSRLLAFILGSNVAAANHALLKERNDRSMRLTPDAQNAVTGIWRALANKKDRFTGSLHKPASRRSTLRGALALYGSDQLVAARNLVSLLQSREVFEKALIEVIEEHFQISGYQLPD